MALPCAWGWARDCWHSRARQPICSMDIHAAHRSIVITRLPAWHTLACPSHLNLPCCVESSAATHKCHFRVRHFGRVFILPYKKAVSFCQWTWMLVRQQLTLLLLQPLMVLGMASSFALASMVSDITATSAQRKMHISSSLQGTGTRASAAATSK